MTVARLHKQGILAFQLRQIYLFLHSRGYAAAAFKDRAECFQRHDNIIILIPKDIIIDLRNTNKEISCET